MQDTDYYVINQLVMFTGLTDRTIRNYLSLGILQGEKIDGVWRFSAKQVDSFLRHPTVRPSILAKNNSLVYDFLLEDKKKKQEICMILDIPQDDKEAIATFFSTHINNDGYQDIRFSFDGVMDMARVILRGDAFEVLRLVNEYKEKYMA